MFILFVSFLAVMLLVLMNAFFVAAEFSIVKIRSTRIESLASQGSVPARYVKKIISHLDEYLSACQLGITLASLGLGWIGEPAIASFLLPIFRYFDFGEVLVHSISFAVAFSLITGLHIILGELAPKSLAIIKTERIALIVAIPLTIFNKTMYPIIWLFNELAFLALRIFGIQRMSSHEAAHTHDEIVMLVEESCQQGLVDQTELSMVDNIFDFSETPARSIMTPRTDIVCLNTEMSMDEMIAIADENKFSRYPICSENDKDNIEGFIHITDLYRKKLAGKDDSIEDITRKILTVPESTSINTLFASMQRDKNHMALIIDEYGGTAGLATMEDILEEIVGEIHDEFDHDEENVQILEDGTFSVSGTMAIEDIEDLLGIPIDAEGSKTIGGWLYGKLEPDIADGSMFEYDGFLFTITTFGHHRVERISIHRIEIPNPEDKANTTQNNYE